MEQHQNARAGETGDPKENLQTTGIFRHNSHMRKSGSNLTGNGTQSPRWKASSPSLKQLGFYCLCIVGISSGSQPTFYVWTEEQSGKGAREVSSALVQHLQQMHLSENVRTIRLFCDGWKDWALYDIKQLSFKEGCFKRLEGISGLKRINIKQETVTVSNKKRTSLKVVLPQLPLKPNITAAKQKDVNNFLEILYGKEWRGDNRRKGYENIVKTSSTTEAEEDVDAIQEDSCNCLDDNCGMHS
ncbi:hypothetical protein PR048_021428 [Dryococelus australis]|uniref:Uncharacterized protein n=1 Tax=Dryococelus australis TaxID=614101 RepID=A0ABQ9GY57_9NEOP|nr:hypothetical protein PR048_021428 [Dryococelus australis]